MNDAEQVEFVDPTAHDAAMLHELEQKEVSIRVRRDRVRDELDLTVRNLEELKIQQQEQLAGFTGALAILAEMAAAIRTRLGGDA